MYKIILFTITLSLGVCSSLLGQGIFGATLLGGINACQIDGDDFAGFNKVGLNVGIRGDVYFHEKMSLGMELSFSQRGSRSELIGGQSPFPQLKIDVNYIQVPVLLRYYDWYIEDGEYFRVFALGGFSYGRLFSSKALNSNFEGQTDLFKENDVSLHLGLGYQFNPSWALTLRFNKGLTRLFDSRDAPLVSRSMVNRWLTFRIEYSL
ncbi:MAG: PorT family protein [Saprospiraceae bacterium]|nr:PorT family protein [Saprospiraceae bacterium]